MPRTHSGRREESEAAAHENICPGQNQCRNAFLFFGVAVFYFDVAAHLSTRRLVANPPSKLEVVNVRVAGEWLIT